MTIFNYKWKYLGWLLILAGAILTIFYVTYDFRLSMPVLAVYSHFMEMKFLKVFETNIVDEILLICLLLGFFLIVFSNDKDDSVDWSHVQAKALNRSLFWNTFFLFFCIIFIYGQGFFVVMILNMYSIFIFYLFFYSRFRAAERKLLKPEENVDP